MVCETLLSHIRMPTNLKFHAVPVLVLATLEQEVPGALVEDEPASGMDVDPGGMYIKRRILNVY